MVHLPYSICMVHTLWPFGIGLTLCVLLIKMFIYLIFRNYNGVLIQHLWCYGLELWELTFPYLLHLHMSCLHGPYIMMVATLYWTARPDPDFCVVLSIKILIKTNSLYKTIVLYESYIDASMNQRKNSHDVWIC